MKKIILTVAAVFALTFANAQDKKESSEGLAKGDLFLTGTAAYGSVTNGDLKANSLTLSPGVGYFLTENLALVGQLSISSGKDYEDDGAGGLVEVKTSGFGITAGVNYYWTPASKFSLSLGGNISYNSNKQDFGGGDVEAAEKALLSIIDTPLFPSRNCYIRTKLLHESNPKKYSLVIFFRIKMGYFC